MTTDKPLTKEQEDALKALIEQAQKLDMGYGKDPTGLTPQNPIIRNLRIVQKRIKKLISKTK